MKKFKNIFTFIIAVVLSLNSFNFVHASVAIEDLKKQEITEVTEYLKDLGPVALEFKVQKMVYFIPLSTGGTATYTIEMRKLPSAQTVMEAKVGRWNIDTSFSIPVNGSIKASAVLNVTYVPNMSSSGLDCPKFTVSSPSISVTPPQGAKLLSSSCSVKEVQTNHEYHYDGYSSLDFLGLTINHYPHVTYACLGNSGTNRNKLLVDSYWK